MPDKNLIIAALIIGGATALGLLKRFSVDVGFDTSAGQGDIGFNFGEPKPDMPDMPQDQTDPSRSSAPEPQTPTPAVADNVPRQSSVIPNYALPYYPYYAHWPSIGWPYYPYWRGWRGSYWHRPFFRPRPWLARF